MHLLRLLEPVVRELDVSVDKRPLRTLVQTVEAIVSFRDQNHGVVLSELGGYMDGLGHGGATKRLSTLIHHHAWKAEQIDAFLLRRADAQMVRWETREEEGLLIWDGTVLEKPESLKAEGLCAVRSSKALRLTRVKKGYYHPEYPDWPLTLVVGRRKGGKPWYLLTNEVVNTAEDAWKVVLAYARRWQIEMAFRTLKSELAIQSVRVYEWEARLKLPGMLTLAYAFLMDLMRQESKTARDWLIEYACHRTGERLREAEIPFTRSRIALSKLWLAYRKLREEEVIADNLFLSQFPG